MGQWLCRGVYRHVNKKTFNNFSRFFHLLLSVSSSHRAASILEGIVVKIADGDTITILDSDRVRHRVRVAGTDSPEKGQPSGNASRKRMSELMAREWTSPRPIYRAPWRSWMQRSPAANLTIA